MDKKLKHSWFMNLRHWLFGHQILWGDWVDTLLYEDDPKKWLTYGRCRYCGYEGIIDSQGNLF